MDTVPLLLAVMACPDMPLLLAFHAKDATAPASSASTQHRQQQSCTRPQVHLCHAQVQHQQCQPNWSISLNTALAIPAHEHGLEQWSCRAMLLPGAMWQAVKIQQGQAGDLWWQYGYGGTAPGSTCHQYHLDSPSSSLAYLMVYLLNS
jgi:hypothetical protein